VILFYLFALLPILAGVVLLSLNKKVCWQEVLGSAALAFVTAGLFHVFAIRSQIGDYETWSGQVTKATHYPRWVEEHTYQEDIKDKKGNVVGHRTKHDYITHSESWDCETSISSSHGISSSQFQEICSVFGGYKSEWAYKSDFYSGDHNIYVSRNTTGYVIPVNEWHYFENRIKAQPNLFQFSKVPPGTKVYPYPANSDWLHSDRVVGTAGAQVNRRELDLLNTRLGPTKKVNLILVGFPTADAEIGQLQQAAWVNGRKNDLVLCYDTTNDPPYWAYCFGWTEQEIVKRNLESLAMQVGVTTATLPKLEAEIGKSYLIKDWHKFDYISVPVPNWALIWMPFVTLVLQGAYWAWAMNNEYDGVQ